MIFDERSHHAPYLELEEVLGTEEATTLIEYLPPVGWADVATKRDLDTLEARLTDRLTASFRGEGLTQTRTMIFALISAIFTMTGVVTGVVFAARIL